MCRLLLIGSSFAFNVAAVSASCLSIDDIFNPNMITLDTNT